MIEPGDPFIMAFLGIIVGIGISLAAFLIVKAWDITKKMEHDELIQEIKNEVLKEIKE